MVKQLETLCRLNGIECRFGGLALLERYGIVDIGNEADLFVDPYQFGKLDQVLSRAGKKQESEPRPEYMTTHFGEYTFEEKDIVVMSSFRMKCTDGIYTHPYIEPDGEWMHLEEWVVLYTVMDRRDQLERLTHYFETHHLNEVIVQTCLKRAPNSVIEHVTERFGERMKH